MDPLPSLPIVLSYTNISRYLNCPKQFWHRDVKKDLPDEIKTGEQFKGTQVHDALKKRLKIREPLPREFQQHEGICARLEKHHSIKRMELKLGVDCTGEPCDFFASNVALRGVLDLACTEAPNALLVDWKNGRRWEDALELRIQAILLAAAYPELTRIFGFYYWLRDGAVGQLHGLDPRPAWGLVHDIASAIAARLRRAPIDFPPDEGPLCPWCPVPRGDGAPLDPVCRYRKDKP